MVCSGTRELVDVCARRRGVEPTVNAAGRTMTSLAPWRQRDLGNRGAIGEQSWQGCPPWCRACYCSVGLQSWRGYSNRLLPDDPASLCIMLPAFAVTRRL
jgi:hypothetical protein